MSSKRFWTPKPSHNLNQQYEAYKNLYLSSPQTFNDSWLVLSKPLSAESGIEAPSAGSTKTALSKAVLSACSTDSVLGECVGLLRQAISQKEWHHQRITQYVFYLQRWHQANLKYSYDLLAVMTYNDMLNEEEAKAWFKRALELTY